VRRLKIELELLLDLDRSNEFFELLIEADARQRHRATHERRELVRLRRGAFAIAPTHRFLVGELVFSARLRELT